MADAILYFVLSCILVIVIGMFMKSLGQPAIIGYIIAGIFLGPSVLGFLENSEFIRLLGEVGIILLLFFIGMEISLPKLISRWRIAIIGTSLQVILSTALVVLIGKFMGWSFATSLLIGFGISLSSTAVILKLLESRGELSSKVGQNVLSVLLVQDILIVPMLIVVSLLGEGSISYSQLGLQIVGMAIFIGVIVYLVHRKSIQIPFTKTLSQNHELQLFLAFLFCFSFAAIAVLFNLSAALGSFVAGMVVAKTKEEGWIHDTLHHFRVLFVAVFFISVGLLIDISFVSNHIWLLLGLVLVILLTNTVINAIIFRFLQNSKSESIYAGSMLSQIGEFSFLLAAVGLSVGLVADFEYQVIIATIAISLLVSPFWIGLFSRIISRQKVKEQDLQKP